jgi:hypothetical protein
LRADLASSIHTITDNYIQIRYGNATDKIDTLKSQVREFKPAR